MARPKAADPKSALTIRLRKSTMDVLADRAEQHGITVREYVERKLEEAAERTVAPLVSSLSQRRTPREKREVIARFKKA